jgi:hypothetical protein
MPGAATLTFYWEAAILVLRYGEGLKMDFVT